MSVDPIHDLEAREAALVDELRRYGNAPTTTASQDARADNAIVELEAVRAELDTCRAREVRRAELRRPGGVPPRLTAGNVSHPDGSSFNVNRRSDPFDVTDLERVDPDTRLRETRSRALDVIEHRTRGDHVTDDALRHAIGLLEGWGGDVARDTAELILATGTDAYQRAFREHLKDPAALGPRMELERMTGELHSRTAVAMAGVQGALHLPYQLDPTILLTNGGVVNPVRQVFRNVKISGTNTWQQPTTSGVLAGLVGESAQFTDQSPTFTSTAISCYKAASFAFGSWEALDDSGLADDLPMMFADAKERMEAGYFTTGLGPSYNQPQGVITFASNATSIVAGTSGAANSADLTAADIYNVRKSLSPRWRPDAVWLASLDTSYAIRQLGTSTNYHAFSLDVTAADGALQLLGRPFYEVSNMATSIVSGSTDFILWHGSPQGFVTVDRVGMVLQYAPIITSGSKFPTGESGWFAWWRFGSGGLVQDSARMLKL